MADRGRKLDDVIVNQVKGMLRNKLTIAEICRAMGLSRPTVKKIIKQYEEENHEPSISH